jgi:hypothetical protein
MFTVKSLAPFLSGMIVRLLSYDMEWNFYRIDLNFDCPYIGLNEHQERASIF